MTTARVPRVAATVAESDTVQVFLGGDPSLPAQAAKSALNDTVTAATSITSSGTLAVTGASTLTGAVTMGTSLAVATTSTERATIKGIYTSTISVTVPSITDPDIAKVDVDVSGLTFQPIVGDMVIVSPVVALPTNARLQGAWVSDTDNVQITYGSEGGNVTGAAKNHKFLFFDLT